MFKAAAKKIIINPSFSFYYTTGNVPQWFSSRLLNLDAYFQNWALVQSDFFSPGDWHEIQFKKLKNILVHAGENVPYWRSLFKKIGFDPTGFKNFEDLDRIPVTTRAELKEIPLANLVAKNTERVRFVETFTSGSTGEPLRFFQDKRELFRRMVNTFQELRYLGFSRKSKVLVLGFGGRKDLDGVGIRILPSDLEDDGVRLGFVYPLILRYCPELLITTPSYLNRFVHYCRKENFFPKFRAVTYMSEEMSPEDIKSVENFFNAKVFSTYGTRECSLVGIQCQEKNFHTAPWMNFIEIVDGQVVVTTFENQVMPFIRYAVGDRGVFKPDFCSCGRTSKTLEFMGRIMGNINFFDGKAFPLYHVFSHIEQFYSGRIIKFQLEQLFSGSYIFRYVVARGGDARSIKQELNNFFASLVQNRAQISLEETDYIIPNKEGKTPPYIKNSRAVSKV